MNTRCLDELLMPSKLMECFDDDDHCVGLHSCAGTRQQCGGIIQHCACTTEDFSVTVQHSRYNGAS